MYDAAIIGTGPAGLSAALNLQIHRKKFIWIGTKQLSDKVEKAKMIFNYPGLSKITGTELMAAFQKQILDMELEITEAMVGSILPISGYYGIMAGSELYESKTIILATGVAEAATLPGEIELVGKGISYCATCDGIVYRGKRIGIICDSARFESEINYLAEMAEKVYLFAGYPNSTINHPNVVKISEPKEIYGEKHVSGIVLKTGETVAVDGAFCLRNNISMSVLIPGLVMEENHLKVTRNMETSMPGCFAAGDCTGRPYQYTKAVGEGNIAAHSSLEYLSEKEKELL